MLNWLKEQDLVGLGFFVVLMSIGVMALAFAFFMVSLALGGVCVSE